MRRASKCARVVGTAVRQTTNGGGREPGRTSMRPYDSAATKSDRLLSESLSTGPSSYPAGISTGTTSFLRKGESNNQVTGSTRMNSVTASVSGKPIRPAQNAAQKSADRPHPGGRDPERGIHPPTQGVGRDRLPHRHRVDEIDDQRQPLGEFGEDDHRQGDRWRQHRKWDDEACYAEDDLTDDHRPALANASRDPSGQKRTDEGADATDRENETDFGGAEAEITLHVQHVDRQKRVAGKTDQRPASGQRAQDRMVVRLGEYPRRFPCGFESPALAALVDSPAARSGAGRGRK